MLHGAKARTNFQYSQEEVAQLSSMDHNQQQVNAGAPCAPCHTWQPMQPGCVLCLSVFATTTPLVSCVCGGEYCDALYLPHACQHPHFRQHHAREHSLVQPEHAMLLQSAHV